MMQSVEWLSLEAHRTLAAFGVFVVTVWLSHYISLGSMLAAATLGALVWFFEAACAVSAYMDGVNPFDQPGVEAYKKIMRELLRIE